MTGHLIHVGYAKAGTTFLKRWLAGHPDLAYSEGGLAGYPGVLALAAAAATPVERTRWRVTSSERLSAPLPDAGTGIIDYGRPLHGTFAERQAEACALLAQIFPDAHILIVTRGFRAIILSSYSQYVRSGGQEDFETLYRGDHLDHPWHYDALIRTYREAFGSEKVILLPFELLRDDPARFTAIIESRLGIGTHAAGAEALNPSLSPLELRWYPRLARRLGRLPVGAANRRRLQARFFGAVDRGKLGWLVRLAQRIRPAPPFATHLVDNALLASMKLECESLAREPYYEPYRADYCLAEVGEK